MTSAKFSPVYILRSYVWDVIKANTNLKESDYNGLVPIVPVAEEPELTQFSQPHIVYGYMLGSTSGLPVIKRGTMTFIVYSNNFGTLTQIVNIIEHALGRTDESAKDVNEYKAQIPQYAGIRFGEIHVALVQGPSPEVGEGGRQSAVVNVSFTYFIDNERTPENPNGILTNPSPTI